MLLDLETIALAMLRDGVAQSSEASVAAAHGHLPNVYMESGLLQRNGTLVHFPHLTFQEYFAGRALARWFLSSDSTQRAALEQFLQQYKYHPRFGVALRFMMGEAVRQCRKARQRGTVLGLLQLLDTPPREVAGLQHMGLLLQMVNEWLCLVGSQGRPVLKTLEQIQAEHHLSERFATWLHAAIRLVTVGD